MKVVQSYLTNKKAALSGILAARCQNTSKRPYLLNHVVRLVRIVDCVTCVLS